MCECVFSVCMMSHMCEVNMFRQQWVHMLVILCVLWVGHQECLCVCIDCGHSVPLLLTGLVHSWGPKTLMNVDLWLFLMWIDRFSHGHSIGIWIPLQHLCGTWWTKQKFLLGFLFVMGSRHKIVGFPGQEVRWENTCPMPMLWESAGQPRMQLAPLRLS